MFKTIFIFAVLSGFGLGDEEKVSCPPFFENIADRCFFFSTTMGGDTKSWHAARDYCHGLSMDYNTELAVLGYSCAEDEALLSVLATKGIGAAWIGASDVVQQGVWQWLDGRNVDLSSHAWEPTKPSTSASANCAQVSYYLPHQRMYFIDQNCDSINAYICETGVITKTEE